MIAAQSRLRFGAFATGGAAFAVGVGYMDPGNWATDLDAARYGNALLWAVIVSGVAATLLQILAVRHAAESKRSLAESIARRWPHAARFLWPAYAAAIVATEIAEFTGVVLGLELVTSLSRTLVVALAGFTFLALLACGATSARRFERLAIATTAVLAGTSAIALVVLHPAVGPIVAGIVHPKLPDGAAFLAVIGIVGATIMPHNLFMHGALFLDRVRAAAPADADNVRRRAERETIVALTFATGINAAILIVGAAIHATDIETAFRALHASLGAIAGIAFAATLIVAALAATASGVCAGDAICGEGAPLRLSPIMRRLCALVPAMALLGFGFSASTLIVVSQIALGLILPTVVVPLIALVCKGTLRRTHGGRLLIAATTIVGLGSLSCDGILIVTTLTHG